MSDLHNLSEDKVSKSHLLSDLFIDLQAVM